MGNKLGKDIQDKYVIVSEEYIKGDVPERVFHCRDGFGCKPFTIGSAVFGEFIATGETPRIEGYMVERFAKKKEISQAEQLRKQYEETRPRFTAEDIQEDENGYFVMLPLSPMRVRVIPRPTRDTDLTKGVPHTVFFEQQDGLNLGVRENGGYTNLVFRIIYEAMLHRYEPHRLRAKEKRQAEKTPPPTIEQAYKTLCNWAAFATMVHGNQYQYPIDVIVPDEVYMDRFHKPEYDKPLKDVENPRTKALVRRKKKEAEKRKEIPPPSEQ